MKKINRGSKHKKGEFKIDAEMMFYFILMAILPVYVAVLYLQFKTIDDLGKDPYFASNVGKISVKTDKAIYNFGESIVLAIENNSEQSIYSEPCEYLDNFEKLANGKWESFGAKRESATYDESGFNLSKKIAKCSLPIPKEEGIYRFSVMLYRGCKKPELCEGATTFYSNEFKVVSNGEKVSNTN